MPSSLKGPVKDTGGKFSDHPVGGCVVFLQLCLSSQGKYRFLKKIITIFNISDFL